MVDLTYQLSNKYWTDYLTGFYFSQREGYNDIEYSGTNAEVKADLHHIPYWDEDYEEYEYIDALSPDERSLDMTMIYHKFRGEINWNWYQFGLDFTNLPVKALNMQLTDAYAERNPVTFDFDYITISMKNADGTYLGYVTIPSIDFKEKEDAGEPIFINYETLLQYDPLIPDTATIFNIQFDPNNQDDYTTDQFGPWGLSAHSGLDGNTMASSWFVTDWQRTRDGQYRAILKRDIVADNYDKVIQAPAIINRATITDPKNPFIFNPEGFSFNQIKTNEILLKDSSKTPWYVMYFKKGTAALTGGFTPASMARYDVQINTPIASSIYAQSDKYYVTNVKPGVRYRVSANDWAWSYTTNQYIMWVQPTGNPTYEYEALSMVTDVMWFANMQDTCKSQLNPKFNGQYTSLKNKVIADCGYSATISESDYKKLLAVPKNGIVVKDSDNKLWEVKVQMTTNKKSGNLSSGTYKNAVANLIDATSLDQADHFGARTCCYKMDLISITINVTEYTSNAINWTVDFANKTKTVDSDFDIIAIPYYTVKNTSDTYTAPSDISEMLVNSIAQAAASNLVDVQLIPYCPKQECMSTGMFNPAVLQSTEYTTGSSSPGILMLYLNSANFSFNINQSLTVEESAEAKKIDNECRLYKLVSPNYNGSFEFSVAKNGGISYFNVDVTLIPYNPYIHINPNFQNMYGQDFNDSRGLICGGDFSLPRYTDQFAEYELNNKNYQMIFDRHIRNLDFNAEIARKQQAISGGLGIIKGGAAGAVAGGMAGGPYGAIAGGIIGTGASAIGAAMDEKFLSEQLAEQRSMAIDNYQYQLGNIKALPDTINKVTPLTYNHKLWPFIEIYTATDDEIAAFKQFLTYNSMRLEVNGTISNYKQDNRTFIMADIIRIDDIAESANQAYEIYKIIKQGVYI